MAFGTRVLEYWLLGPSGKGFCRCTGNLVRHLRKQQLQVLMERSEATHKPRMPAPGLIGITAPKQWTRHCLYFFIVGCRAIILRTVEVQVSGLIYTFGLLNAGIWCSYSLISPQRLSTLQDSEKAGANVAVSKVVSLGRRVRFSVGRHLKVSLRIHNCGGTA